MGRYPKHPILMVDDDPKWLKAFSFSLEYSAGLDHVVTCADSREVLDRLSRQDFSLVLLDLTMPYLCGEELLETIRARHPELPVIIVSGVNQAETAVRCLQAGAFNYFVKTSEPDRLLAGIRNALSLQQKREEVQRLRDRFFQARLNKPEAFRKIITQDPRMQSVMNYTEAVSCSPEPVLITGESGVGKDLVARALHDAGEASGEYVAVNVAGLDDHVFADTLFGHLRGAFTGADRPRAGLVEQARGGTLFLDEIGDLSPASQVKLLRFLQNGEYFPLGSDRPRRANARIVCATNVDLEERQRAGAFRSDLFYRLNTHRIHVPPLRERSIDLPLLLGHFVAEASRDMKKKTPTVPRELAILLAEHPFPGNVRELRSMVYNALSQHQEGALSPDAFRTMVGNSPSARRSDTDEKLLLIPGRMPTLEEASRLLTLEALERAQGNQTLASGLLGITQQALSKRLKKFRSAP